MPAGPVEAVNHWVTSQGARLWVRVAGDGAPLVLVHGWAMDHRVFRPQVDALARHFSVLTYDRRGYGRSAGRPDLNREVDDLDAIARALIGEPFHLLGLSQGGRIALRCAAAGPDRLRSLIVQGAPLAGEEHDGPVEERIPLDEFADLAKAGRLDVLRRRWLKHPMTRLGEDHPEAERLLREMVADYSGADLINGGWRLHGAETDVLQTIAEAALPVLILTGARETEARRRSARLLLESLPDARELVLPHSGHLSNLTEPETYNAAVIDFCAEVDSQRQGGPGV